MFPKLARFQCQPVYQKQMHDCHVKLVSPFASLRTKKMFVRLVLTIRCFGKCSSLELEISMEEQIKFIESLVLFTTFPKFPKKNLEYCHWLRLELDSYGILNRIQFKFWRRAHPSTELNQSQCNANAHTENTSRLLCECTL